MPARNSVGRLQGFFRRTTCRRAGLGMETSATRPKSASRGASRRAKFRRTSSWRVPDGGERPAWRRKSGYALSADLVEVGRLELRCQSGAEGGSRVVAFRGVHGRIVSGEEGRGLIAVAEGGEHPRRGNGHAEVGWRQRKSRGDNDVPHVSCHLGMEQAGIHVGGEDRLLGEDRSQRLDQQELVVDILADHADRLDRQLRILALVGLQAPDQSPDIVALGPCFPAIRSPALCSSPCRWVWRGGTSRCCFDAPSRVAPSRPPK